MIGSPSWRHDAPAALVVFFIAVPLCLGIALTSGAPLMSGIIAGIVGGIVVGSLSDSQLMVSGPAAGLAVIVLAALSELGAFETFLAAVVLAGVMQLVLGFLRAGVVGYYFPSAVIKGMLAAIGLLLILKQIPHALGHDADAMGDDAFRQANNETTFSALGDAVANIERGVLLVAVISLVLLFTWGRGVLRPLKNVPASLVVVVLGVALNAAFARVAPSLVIADTHLVSLPVAESLGAFFSQFTLPDFAAFAQPAVWRVAAIIALVASLESLLALQATDDMDEYHREASTDRELFAQGTGNIISGLIGGLPITGLVVRSATNIDARARTRWSTILHGVLLLVAAAAFAPLLNQIPLASIAAVLIHVGYRLANPRTLSQAARKGRAYALPFFVTIGAILLTDMLRGILIGLAVGIVVILRDHVKSPPYTEVSGKGAVLRRLQLHNNVNFLHKAALLTELEAMPMGSRIEIDARNTRRLDPDVLEVLLNFRETARLREIDYRLVGIATAAPTTT